MFDFTLNWKQTKVSFVKFYDLVKDRLSSTMTSDHFQKFGNVFLLTIPLRGFTLNKRHGTDAESMWLDGNGTSIISSDLLL